MKLLITTILLLSAISALSATKPDSFLSSLQIEMQCIEEVMLQHSNEVTNKELNDMLDECSIESKAEFLERQRANEVI